MWPFFVMCITMGYFFHAWGGVGVEPFFCFLISICTELLYLYFWEGNLNNLQLNNCFWKIWAALKRAYGGYKTHPDWLASKEAAAVETVLWW